MNFLDLISKVFQIRDIMPHDLEILRDTIEMWSSNLGVGQQLYLRILPWSLFVLLYYVR